MTLRLVTVALFALIAITMADPTMYKKNQQNLYEPGKWLLQIQIEFGRRETKEKTNVNDGLCPYWDPLAESAHTWRLQSYSFPFNEVT